MNTNPTVSCRSIAAARAKKMRALCFGTCALAIVIVASAGEPAARFITFDAPGAGTGAFQGTGCFAVTDCSVVLNNWGALTGYYLDANNVFHGFVRSPEGRFTSFDSPGADKTPNDFNGTLPNAINDLGAITGAYYDVNGAGHGFLRTPGGAFKTFDVPGGSLFTNPIHLNLEGSIVGASLDENGVFQGFLRRPDGKFERWIGPGACDATPATGCYGTAAFSINLFGTIAGHYEDNNAIIHGLVRSPEGKFTAFEAPGAGAVPGSFQGTGCPGCSFPLNLFGAIAGYFIDTNNVVHGFVRSPWGEITTFDAPAAAGPYGFNCYADCSVGLNDWGAVTGFYLDANNVYHGFVRSPNGKITSFDAPGADLTAQDFNGTFPVSINDQGAIAGYYYDAKNVAHGFLRLSAGGD